MFLSDYIHTDRPFLFILGPENSKPRAKSSLKDEDHSAFQNVSSLQQSCISVRILFDIHLDGLNQDGQAILFKKSSIAPVFSGCGLHHGRKRVTASALQCGNISERHGDHGAPFPSSATQSPGSTCCQVVVQEERHPGHGEPTS